MRPGGRHALPAFQRDESGPVVGCQAFRGETLSVVEEGRFPPRRRGLELQQQQMPPRGSVPYPRPPAESRCANLEAAQRRRSARRGHQQRNSPDAGQIDDHPHSSSTRLPGIRHQTFDNTANFHLTILRSPQRKASHPTSPSPLPSSVQSGETSQSGQAPNLPIPRYTPSPRSSARSRSHQGRRAPAYHYVFFFFFLASAESTNDKGPEEFRCPGSKVKLS